MHLYLCCLFCTMKDFILVNISGDTDTSVKVSYRASDAVYQLGSTFL